MRGYMFRNRWFALLFVALVLAGVTRVVGTGKGDGMVDLAKDQLAHQRDRAAALSDAPQQIATKKAPTVEFASDEELIDLAIGEDPTPADPAPPGAEEPAAPTVFLIEREPAAGPPGAEAEEPALP